MTQELGIDEGEVKQWEVKRVVHKLKGRKAAGPDEIPMVLFKELDDDNLKKVQKVLN